MKQASTRVGLAFAAILATSNAGAQTTPITGTKFRCPGDAFVLVENYKGDYLLYYSSGVVATYRICTVTNSATDKFEVELGASTPPTKLPMKANPVECMDVASGKVVVRKPAPPNTTYSFAYCKLPN